MKIKRRKAWFKYHLSNGSEDVTGILKSMRCKCECADVDKYIKRRRLRQAGWNSYEKSVYHTEMKKPEHKLNWPVDPPASVDVDDRVIFAAVDPKDKADTAALMRP